MPKNTLDVPSHVYSFNPHRHVKIWISTRPDSFLNAENQLRLIRMRTHNPRDAIALVYSEAVLTEQAIIDLQLFCEAHTIEPVSYEEQIKPALATEREQSLACFIDREIAALGEGGNVGAISDLMRWLSPVYQRGTYADFDVGVDTSGLEATIEVQSALLLSIGSFIYCEDIHTLTVNNDIISVVDVDAAHTSITLIQDDIIQAYTSPEFSYCTRTDEGENQLRALLPSFNGRFVKPNPEREDLEELDEMRARTGARDPLSLRQYLHNNAYESRHVYCCKEMGVNDPDSLSEEEAVEQFSAWVRKKIMRIAYSDASRSPIPIDVDH